MAKILCDVNNVTNEGEKAFLDAAEKYLDSGTVVYWNREISGLEFDFCLLLPEEGILVVEVKGWHESSVISVSQNDCIMIHQNGETKRQNPRNQARSYAFAILNAVSKKLGKHPPVYHMVCYPFISQEFFDSHKMDLISARQITFVKEDLASHEAFHSKLHQRLAYVNFRDTDLFTSRLMMQVRGLFEPVVALDETEIRESFSQNKQTEEPQGLIPIYSILTYIPGSIDDWRGLVDDLVRAYFSGARIYCMVESEDILNYIIQRISNVLAQKGLRVDSKGNLAVGYELWNPVKDEKTVAIFNFSITLLNSMGQSLPLIHIVNGEGIDNPTVIEQLQYLDEIGGFNFQQFQVEHANTTRHTVVRAGAGTGKTYAMILRVSYLCYRESITALDLAKRIVMITFTNDAVDNMKGRLKSWFGNYYLLTENTGFLDIVAQIEQMQISTIHAYALRLVQELGVEAGFGQEVSIASGRYQRKQILESTIEDFVKREIKTNPRYLDQLGLRVYQVVDIFMEFITKLEGKSLDLAKLSAEKFGKADSHEALHRMLVDVLQSTEQKFAYKLQVENRIFLGRIMAVLSNLLVQFSSRLVAEGYNGTKYLFVDEFQDTDDVQIEIIKNISKLNDYRLFVVGDIKQSIYRFRGAEEKAFDHLGIDANRSLWQQFELSKNYRSDTRLLDLYHGIFEGWGNNGRQLLTYGDEDALRGTRSLNGNDMADNEFFNGRTISEPGERIKALFQEVDACVQKIQHARGSLSREERTIAILVRENWQAREIVDNGRQRGYVIESSIGGDLYRSAPAVDMSILLQALVMGGPEHLSRFLTSNFMPMGFDRMKLYKIRKNADNDVRQNQKAYLERLINEGLSQRFGTYKKWSDILDALRKIPVLQVLRALYQQLQPWRHYGRGRRWYTEFYRLNVDLLLEKIVTSKGIDNLSLWQISELLSRNIMTQQEEDCRFPELTEAGNDYRVVCLTVHKSKGLEYGSVILPYTSWKMDRKKKGTVDVTIGADYKIGYRFALEGNKLIQNSYYDETQELSERKKEETRILYVAMTRAIRSLSWIEEADNHKLSWQTLLEKGISYEY